MIPRLRLTRDLIDALTAWNKAQTACRRAYAEGPTKWCWVEDCLNPAVRLCRGHATTFITREGA